MNIGKKLWVVPDMFLPESINTVPYAGHEAICVINTGDEDCKLSMVVYLTDAEPMAPFLLTCPAKRSLHARVNDLKNEKGESVPMGTPYSVVITCSSPVVVQCTRVETTQTNLAYISEIGFGV